MPSPITKKWLGRKIGVVHGGLSDEREVSLETGRALHRALIGLGYDAVLIDAGHDLPGQLLAERVQVVVNGLHGRYGEDGAVQGLLEIMGIPYTGSGVLASALAMDKHLSKLAFAAAGLPLAADVFIRKGELETALATPLPFPFPVVVKPNANGSSVGVTIVKDAADYERALRAAMAVDAAVLVEAFVAGREVSVTVFNGEALGVIEITPAEDFYDYRAKYMVESTQYTYPAPLPAALYREIMDIGTRANEAISGRGLTRSDLIVTSEGRLVVLEINTLPGMTSHSLVPKTALGEGIPFDELVERLLESAAQGG